MNISGQVTDYKTGEPLPAASVTIYNPDGSPTGQGSVAAADGTFNLTSDLLNNNNMRVCFSYVGYTDMRRSPDQANGEIALVPKGDLLGTVVVTAKHIVQNNNVLPAVIFIAVFIGLIILLAKYNKLKAWSVGL